MQRSYNKRRSQRTLPKPVLVLAAVLVLLGLLLAFWQLDLLPGSNKQPAADSDGTVNYDPPTEEEQQSGDRQKEKIEKERLDPPAPSGQQVKPFITDAGQYGNQIEVRSYVPGIYEAGGTCTVTFTKGSATLSRSVKGLEDATTTRCSVVIVPRSEFPFSGSWSVVVKYQSAKYGGSSDTKQIEVK